MIAGDKSTALRLNRVSKTYGSLEVIQEIDLVVHDGEFLALVGPSGCGKTTLLRMMHGLVPPSSGAVIQNDVAIKGPTRDRAIVFQSDSLLPWRSVLDNVAFGLQAAGVRRNDARARAGRFLELVELQDFASYLPHQLSGGMKQRVNLARALAVEPRVLLMDEPFAALDAQTREVMQEELLRLWAIHQQTVVFVTHQIDEAVLLADRVGVLDTRPGRMRRMIDVDIARPRSLEDKRSPAFLKRVDEVWQVLADAARRESRRVM